MGCQPWRPLGGQGGRLAAQPAGSAKHPADWEPLSGPPQKAASVKQNTRSHTAPSEKTEPSARRRAKHKGLELKSFAEFQAWKAWLPSVRRLAFFWCAITCDQLGWPHKVNSSCSHGGFFQLGIQLLKAVQHDSHKERLPKWPFAGASLPGNYNSDILER